MKSYQPKPTTGRCKCGETIYSGGLCERCLRESLPPYEPKPTTGEWTRDGTLIWCDGKIVPDIVTAHNAALAESTDAAVQEMLLVKQQLDAERRAAEVEINEGVAARDINHLNRIDELERQLAAEREAGQELMKMHREAVDKCNEDREQLAAEREKVRLATQMVQIESKRANEAQQKVQMLIDALKDIRVGAPDIVKQQIKDALAKGGEMSDQPKPTTSQRTQCPSCGQIIPTQRELAQPEPTGERPLENDMEWLEKKAGLDQLDQPEPTTGTPCHVIGPSSRMCKHGTKGCEVRHAKPTGGWTAQTVFDLLGSDYGSDGWKRERAVADAHNASLAAERQRADEAEQGELNEATKLAAEREKVQILEDSVNDFTRSNGALTTEVLQLREQLATITKLEHQLSAAQDALKKILSEIREIASTAISEDGK